MSSLRLALKQSLQESGGGLGFASGEDRHGLPRKKKSLAAAAAAAAVATAAAAEHGNCSSSNNNNNNNSNNHSGSGAGGGNESVPPLRKRGRPRKHPLQLQPPFGGSSATAAGATTPASRDMEGSDIAVGLHPDQQIQHHHHHHHNEDDHEEGYSSEENEFSVEEGEEDDGDQPNDQMHDYHHDRNHSTNRPHTGKSETIQESTHHAKPYARLPGPAALFHAVAAVESTVHDTYNPLNAPQKEEDHFHPSEKNHGDSDIQPLLADSHVQQQQQQHFVTINTQHPPDQEQDQVHARNHAANKIQHHWKKANEEKKPPATFNSQAHLDEDLQLSNTNNRPALSLNESAKFESNSMPTACQRLQGAEAAAPVATEKQSSSSTTATTTTTAPGNNTKKTFTTSDKSVVRNKKDSDEPGSSKPKTVPAPTLETVEWMRQLSIKRARRHVVPGLRVKVRFATKIKREGKILRKKKWFGGKISAVSKEGSKIRIKYDDGTAEVTKFPDKDIVVDQANNGQHLAAALTFAEKFTPPPETSSSNNAFASLPTILGEGVKGSAASESTEPIVHDPDLSTSKNQTQQHQHLNKDNAGMTIQASSAHSEGSNRSDKTAPNSTNANEKSSDLGVRKADKPHQKEQRASDDSKRAIKPNTKLDDDTMLMKQPKRKRGRPPKHRRMDAATSSDSVKQPQRGDHSSWAGVEGGRDSGTQDDGMTSSNKVSQDLAETTSNNNTAAVESLKDKASAPSKSSLTIRIPNVKRDAAVATRSPKPGIAKEAGESHTPARVRGTGQQHDTAISTTADPPPTRALLSMSGKKHKRSAVENAEGADSTTSEPPTKKLHIHISSSGMALSTTATNATGGSEDPQTVVTTEPAAPVLVKSVRSKQQQQREKRPDAGGDNNKYDAIMYSPKSPRLKKGKGKRTDTLLECSSETTTMPALPNLTLGVMDSVPACTDGDIAAALLSSQKQSNVNLEGQQQQLYETLASHVDASGQEQADGRSTTVIRLSKGRSGRRAAQQANERIVAKQDPSEQQHPNQVQQQHQPQHLTKKKKPKDKRKDGGGSGVDVVGDESESSEDDSQWVQCDSCRKWRIIPSRVVASLPKQWYCSDNIYDPKRANCDVPEQTMKQVVKEKKRMKKRKRMEAEAAAAVVAAATAVSSLTNEATEETSNNSTTSKGMKHTDAPLPKEHSNERAKSPHPKEELDGSGRGKRGGGSGSVIEPASTTTLYPEMGSDLLPPKSEKKQALTSSSKKLKTVDTIEASCAATTTATSPTHAMENPVVEIRKGRGRPRRTGHPKDVASASAASILTAPQPPNADEADNVEWVQCEKCDKWRKLPPHISADELPDTWYCTMNTWSPAAARCDVPEDKVEGLQDVATSGGLGGAGKLSYRNLIFGNTGRRANRPVSERTRAAESLFSVPPEDDDVPPTVMYANSSAFVCRSKSNQMHHPGNNNENMPVLELMSRSKLWAELRQAAQDLNSFKYSVMGNGPPSTSTSASVATATATAPFATTSMDDIARSLYKLRTQWYYTYDTLPLHLREPIRDLVIKSLSSDSCSCSNGRDDGLTCTMPLSFYKADEVFEAVKKQTFSSGAGQTDKNNHDDDQDVSFSVDDWHEARSVCTIPLIITTLCTLVKEGLVECVAKQRQQQQQQRCCVENGTVTFVERWNEEDWIPHYRLIFPNNMSIEKEESIETRKGSRCMKLAKPWKGSKHTTCIE